MTSSRKRKVMAYVRHAQQDKRNAAREACKGAVHLEVDLMAAKPDCPACHGRGVVGRVGAAGRNRTSTTPLVCACVTRRGGVRPKPWWRRVWHWLRAKVQVNR